MSLAQYILAGSLFTVWLYITVRLVGRAINRTLNERRKDRPQ